MLEGTSLADEIDSFIPYRVNQITKFNDGFYTDSTGMSVMLANLLTDQYDWGAMLSVASDGTEAEDYSTIETRVDNKYKCPLLRENQSLSMQMTQYQMLNYHTAEFFNINESSTTDDDVINFLQQQVLIYRYIDAASYTEDAVGAHDSTIWTDSQPEITNAEDSRYIYVSSGGTDAVISNDCPYLLIEAHLQAATDYTCTSTGTTFTAVKIFDKEGTGFDQGNFTSINEGHVYAVITATVPSRGTTTLKIESI